MEGRYLGGDAKILDASRGEGEKLWTRRRQILDASPGGGGGENYDLTFFPFCISRVLWTLLIFRVQGARAKNIGHVAKGDGEKFWTRCQGKGAKNFGLGIFCNP